jgi:hypothetical protein
MNPDPLNPPAWQSSYAALVAELQENFGLYDVQGEAEDKIGNLYMKENENVCKYNVRFNNLAANMNWDMNALKWAYQRGLASRIKDEMARLPEPPTLNAYRTEVLRIDNRHWKREEEKKRESSRHGNAGSASKTSAKKSSNANTASSSSNSASSSTNNKPASGGNQGKKAPGGKNTPKNPAFTPAGNKPAFADRLGPDGKLTPAESERRKQKGLCAFCGGKHKFEDCNKRKAREAKGRAAETTPETTPVQVESEK